MFEISIYWRMREGTPLYIIIYLIRKVWMVSQDPHSPPQDNCMCYLCFSSSLVQTTQGFIEMILSFYFSVDISMDIKLCIALKSSNSNSKCFYPDLFSSGVYIFLHKIGNHISLFSENALANGFDERLLLWTDLPFSKGEDCSSLTQWDKFQFKY